MTAVLEECSPTDVYRRQARRLRCRYAAQPVQLQRSLKRLADRTPVTRAAPAPSPAEIVCETTGRTGAARRFAGFLAMRMPSADLRYSERLALLRAAGTFGVGRFEANLLIAAVLQRRRAAGRSEPLEQMSPGRGSLLGGVTVFLIVQSALALGAWWTLLR